MVFAIYFVNNVVNLIVNGILEWLCSWDFRFVFCDDSICTTLYPEEEDWYFDWAFANLIKINHLIFLNIQHEFDNLKSKLNSLNTPTYLKITPSTRDFINKIKAQNAYPTPPTDEISENHSCQQFRHTESIHQTCKIPQTPEKCNQFN